MSRTLVRFCGITFLKTAVFDLGGAYTALERMAETEPSRLGGCQLKRTTQKKHVCIGQVEKKIARPDIEKKKVLT